MSFVGCCLIISIKKKVKMLYTAQILEKLDGNPRIARGALNTSIPS